MRVLEDELGHRLLASVEDSKIALSTAPAAQAYLDFIMQDFVIDIKHDTFIGAVESHINDITASLAECLSLAGIHANDIELCVLTGGPTEMPALAQAVLKHLPQAQLSAENKLSSVATGLGHAAGRFARLTS